MLVESVKSMQNEKGMIVTQFYSTDLFEIIQKMLFLFLTSTRKANKQIKTECVRLHTPDRTYE